MYCIKCGADNLEAAKFCRKCGGEINDAGTQVFQENHPDRETRPPLLRKEGSFEDGEEETRVAVRRETDNGQRITENAEPIYHPAGGTGTPPNPGGELNLEEAEIFAISPTLMFVKAGYVGAAVGALLFVGLTSSFLSQYVSVWEAVLLGLLLFLIPAFYHFKQKLVRYTLTDSKLEIDEGFISRTTRSVPIRRIQDVTVSSGVMQRLLGFGNLVIDNASEEGGKVVLKNINTPKHYGDMLLKQMRRIDQ